MSIEVTVVGGAVAAAIVAELQRQEEEEMTPYSDKDLAEGWEFKIVRSTLWGFRKPEQLRAVLAEEKKGGWVLVEKFDDSRIRLKRPAGTKIEERDFEDGYDPYRSTTWVSGENRLLIVAIAAGALALLFIGTAVTFIVSR
ncbi:hypothetical protein Sinac_4103 [Singulisphaera acidiphila DSM 18658]|uniref:Uncharacterized protein n=2 Tax=Singulisphaera acidiphila TaxID=466153 RepID=L0DGB4_SINAD|nr:hypothetical protein Sinac_4103 [Singulisphaera acidiphila DSM 18658]